MDEEEFAEILDFVKDGKYPVRMKNDKNQKRNFRRKCAPFSFDDELYYEKKSVRLRVIKKGKTRDIIKSIHATEHGGHLGVSKTWEKISTRFYWKGSYEEVKEYINSCDNCQRKCNLQKAKKPLRSIPVPPEAFKQVGMDLIGPLETSYEGNKYIVVITDYLTKWVEADAVTDKSSETVLRVFTKFVTTHGCPSVLITDQGREFCNDINDKFCKQFGIEHRIASAYHPQTGGHTERFNRTLCNMLVHVVDSSQRDWDIKLPYVLFAYRTSKHDSTKQTPFYLVFGRQARLPVELDICTSQSEDNDDTILEQRIDSFIKLSCNREQASSNIRTAQSKQKKYHDSSLPTKDTVGYEVGDQVLVHNTRKTTRKGGKLDVKWKGPYIIRKKTERGTYFLEGIKTSVSGNRIASYKTNRGDCESPTNEHDQKCKEMNENKTGCNLPFKKRKLSDQDASISEPEHFQFNPVNKVWQEQMSKLFQSKVKNTYVTGQDRFIRRDANPTLTVNMRGDGNCLFRTFSYIVFGVQTNHSLIRQALISFMVENEDIMKGVMRDRVDRYLDESKMARTDTWGTEVEIFAFATLTGTAVYTYSQYGDEYRWLEFNPLKNERKSDRSVFIQNKNDHFVPVLDVNG